MKRAFVIGLLLCVFSLLLSAASAEKTEGITVLPEELREIGEEAFAGTALETLELPAGILSIGRGAFADMPELSEIRFSEGTTLLTGHGSIGIKKSAVPEQPAVNAVASEEPVIPGSDHDNFRIAADLNAVTGSIASEARNPRSVYTEERTEYANNRAAFHPLNLYFP